VSAPQDREARIKDRLEDADIFLKHLIPENAGDARGRWEILSELMNVARDLRPSFPNPEPALIAGVMQAKLVGRLKDLGMGKDIILDVVESAFGPRLVGAVLSAQQAHQANEAARRAAESTQDAAEEETDDGRGLRLVAVGALLERPLQSRRWLVDGILLAGGLSLLAAKPKVGKSTLARCLCVAIAQGDRWLGREVIQGPVFYLGFEEKLEEVIRHFRSLGVDPGAPLYAYVDLPPLDAMDRLKESVEAKRPALVVVDGLYRLVRVSDESGYAEVYAKLGPLLSLARESGAHVEMTHHEGKRAHGLDGQDGVLGSTALVGSVDATLVIRRDQSGRRTIRSTQRYGADLEESVLEMDDAGLVTLGGSRAAAELDEAQDLILEALARNGPAPEKSGDDRDGLRSLVSGVRTVTLTRALRQLWEAEKVTRTGSGRKGDPYLYGLPTKSECGFSGSYLYTGTCKPESSGDGAGLGSVLS
jgi:hypothetical protein